MMPDGVGTGDALGEAVTDFWPGAGATAVGIGACVAVRRGSDRAFGALGPGRGLRELCGAALVRPGAAVWTRPGLGSRLTLNGA
jgi:hypothetical protein